MYVHHVEPSFTTPRKRHEQCLIHRLAKESIKTRLCRRVARIHKIVTEEIQPKQHVSMPMTLRCSLACRKCKRIYRIHALDANSSHLRRLICFNYIRATRRCRTLEGVPGERWILTSLWKTAWPNSSSRPSGFERPMKHRISVTNEGKLMVIIKLKRA